MSVTQYVAFASRASWVAIRGSSFHSGRSDSVAERRPVVLLVHAQVDVPTVLRAVRVHQRRARAARRTAQLVDAQHRRGHDRGLHRPHAGVEQRGVDDHALPGPLAVEQRGDDARRRARSRSGCHRTRAPASRSACPGRASDVAMASPARDQNDVASKPPSSANGPFGPAAGVAAVDDRRAAAPGCRRRRCPGAGARR